MTLRRLTPLLANLPPVTLDEVARMVDSIREHGQLSPIVLHRGRIVDGRVRYWACRMLGIQPRFSRLPRDADPHAYCASVNLHRRSLSDGQLAVIRVRYLAGRSGTQTGKAGES